jgi:hypothetical protein
MDYFRTSLEIVASSWVELSISRWFDVLSEVKERDGVNGMWALGCR